jgi:hypothetical protein
MSRQPTTPGNVRRPPFSYGTTFAQKRSAKRLTEGEGPLRLDAMSGAPVSQDKPGRAICHCADIAPKSRL